MLENAAEESLRIMPELILATRSRPDVMVGDAGLSKAITHHRLRSPLEIG